jgi:hypothetical protein
MLFEVHGADKRRDYSLLEHPENMRGLTRLIYDSGIFNKNKRNISTVNRLVNKFRKNWEEKGIVEKAIEEINGIKGAPSFEDKGDDYQSIVREFEDLEVKAGAYLGRTSRLETLEDRKKGYDSKLSSLDSKEEDIMKEILGCPNYFAWFKGINIFTDSLTGDIYKKITDFYKSILTPPTQDFDLKKSVNKIINEINA